MKSDNYCTRMRAVKMTSRMRKKKRGIAYTGGVKRGGKWPDPDLEEKVNLVIRKQSFFIMVLDSNQRDKTTRFDF